MVGNEAKLHGGSNVLEVRPPFETRAPTKQETSHAICACSELSSRLGRNWLRGGVAPGHGQANGTSTPRSQ